MKKIGKLHYITQDIPGKPPWLLAEEACKAGIRWVQLRVKNKSDEEWLEIALKVSAVCHKYGTVLIINDHVELARIVCADGVHLGKADMDPGEARVLLGKDKIIGGTANTMKDIERLIGKVDYIGLGPYRFTETKEKLSPILGLDGFRDIMEQCSDNQLDIPIIGIGGIRKDDIPLLLQTGIHGVAVASGIGKSSSVKKAAEEWVNLLNDPVKC
jgi:thiamine-phosphate pyrophosphorylase